MQKTSLNRSRGGFSDVIAGLKAYFKARGEGQTLSVIRRKQHDRTK